MLLKLIKTREMHTGVHAELWRKDRTYGDLKLAEVFVLNENLPSAVIHRVQISARGIFIHSRHVGLEWESPIIEATVITYLLAIQESREEIYLDVCEPVPEFPGYPDVDLTSPDYPVVLMYDEYYVDCEESIDETLERIERAARKKKGGGK